MPFNAETSSISHLGGEEVLEKRTGQGRSPSRSLPTRGRRSPPIPPNTPKPFFAVVSMERVVGSCVGKSELIKTCRSRSNSGQGLASRCGQAKQTPQRPAGRACLGGSAEERTWHLGSGF